MKLIKIIIVVLGILLLLYSPFYIAEKIVSLGKLVDTIPELAERLRKIENLNLAKEEIARRSDFETLVEFGDGSWIFIKSKYIYKYSNNILDYEKPWFIGLKFDNGDLLFVVDETGSADSFSQFHYELSNFSNEQSYDYDYFLKNIQDLCVRNNFVIFKYE